MMREDEALTTTSETSRWKQDGGWVGSIVQVAQVCNQLFTNSKSCRMCHVYAEKQVEYETQHESSRGDQGSKCSPVERAWMKAAAGLQHHNMEIDLYRQFLFDENSVGGSAIFDDDADVMGEAFDKLVGMDPDEPIHAHHYGGGSGVGSGHHATSSAMHEDEDGNTVSTQRTN